MKTALAALVLSLFTTAAFARSADGRLDAVVSPNSTQPAIVSRGGDLEVLLREAAELRLESASGVYALRASPPRPLRGLLRVLATLDPDAPAGAYTLVAKTASGEDRSYRSVAVLDAPLESYRVAVWSNLRVGADPQRPDSALFRTSAQINSGNAALVLVTGDLTLAGSPEQFRLALDVLNDCIAPTLVAPGHVDLDSGRAQDYLGPRPVAVPFGLDGFLLCPAAGPNFSADAGRLYSERRRIRAARWSVGAGFGADMRDLRPALTVLVDDPLDAVLGALDVPADNPPGQASPWGRVKFFVAPVDRGALRWFTVGPRGVALDTSKN